MGYKNSFTKKIERKYINEARKTLLTIIAEEVVVAMKNNITDTVYSKPEGDYERKFAMLHSVASKVTEDSFFTTEIEISPEPDRMTYDYHSWYGSSDNRDMIVEWLNNGTDNKFYPHPAHNFIGLTAEQVADIVSEALSKAFARIASK